MFKKSDVQDAYPLTPMQEGMLYHYLLNRKNHDHIKLISYDIQGEFDVITFEKAFNFIIDRYDVLRTIFLHENVNNPLQVVLKNRTTTITFEDISELDNEKIKLYINKKNQTEIEKGFNLSKDLLIKIYVFQIAKDRFMIIVYHHHIIIDGWSTGILLKELFDAYECLRKNTPLAFPTRKSFSHYIKWYEKQDDQQAGKFWKNYLSNISSQTALFPIEVSEKDSYKNEKYTYILPSNMVEELINVARHNNITPNTVMQTVWGILLQKINRTLDAVYGFVVSGRPPEITEITEMVGLFINTIPVRITRVENETFVDLVLKVHSELTQAKRYEFLPLVDILSYSNLNPLFDHLVVFDNFPMGSLPKETSVSINGVDLFEQTNYDFILSIIPGKEWHLEFKYNSYRFENKFVKKLGQRIHTVCEQIVENPNILIEDISILLEEEKQQILSDFNDTDAVYPEHTCIIELFEQQVERQPDKIAVKLSEKTLTYSEVNHKANQLAHVLIKKGICTDHIVGILLDRSIEMVISILATLKARGAYMPIDPDYPSSRKHHMISDSGTSLVLTKSRFLDEITIPCESILLDELLTVQLQAEPATNPPEKGTPGDLAYVIYTSGSTGIPKGVLIENRNVVRLLFNDRFQFDFSAKDVWTVFHSFCFDVSVWEMYGALLYGGTAILMPKEVTIDTEQFREILKKENVTILSQTPSAFYNLAEEEKTHTDNLSVRNVIFAGEALQPALLRSWKKKYEQCKLINMYGITETTIHSTYKEINWDEIENGISNVGKPLPTLKIYIVDECMKLVPVNVIGELCVSGAGVCRGYLNRPGLTAERFLDDPFNPGKRLYKSGDLAYYLENGELIYIGRKDNQIQLHGFRIELGEVEQAMLKIDGIKQAVVLAHSTDHQNTYLCGYYVADKVKTVEQLREELKTLLPDYMIPAYFIHLEAIPLNANGKVDRKTLPKPKESIHSIVEYVAPRNESEARMAEIWKEFLGIEKIGINNSFFSLGGDSIVSIRLVSKINKIFETNLKIADLYNYQTIKEFTHFLKSRENATQKNLDALVLKEIEKKKQEILAAYNLPEENIEDIYPMSDIEQGMLFYSLKFKEKPVYYDQIMVRMDSSNFDIDKSKKALHLLFQKHAIFRSGFLMEQSVKIVYKHLNYPIDYFDISTLSGKEQETRIQDHLYSGKLMKFDVETTPLWRMTFYKLTEDKIAFLWEFHHAILDGWSTSSFLTEYNNIMLRLEKEPDFIPTNLGGTYKDHTIEEIKNKQDDAAKQFWKDELREYNRFSFPKFCKEKKNGKFSRDLGFDLKKECVEFSVQNNIPLRHIGFAAYRFMLHMISDNNDVVVGLLTNNRPTCEDGDKIIGCFLKTIPVRMKINSNITWMDYVQFVDQKINKIRTYDKLSLLDIMKISGENTSDGNPLFDDIFSFLDFHILKDLEEFDFEREDLNFEAFEQTNMLFTFTLDTTFHSFKVIISYFDLPLDYGFLDKLVFYFKRILETIVRKPTSLLDRGMILSDEEKNSLLTRHNDLYCGYTNNVTLIDLFERQAVMTPDNTAVIFGNQQLTYFELNTRANQLARILVKNGVKANDIVGILLEHSADMITAILAVLKARGAYMPIDTEYPQERQNFMISDSGTRVIISIPEFITPLDYQYTTVFLNDDLFSLPLMEEVPLKKGKSEDLAYVLYTSGSTGQPKGTLLEHQNVVRLFIDDQLQFKFNEHDVWVLFHSFCFDFSVWEMYGALLSGGKLVVLPKKITRDFQEFRKNLRSENVTVLNQTPSAFYALLNEEEAHDNRLSVRYVILGGEALHPALLRSWKNKYPDCQIINMYGITETAVHSTYKEIKRHDIESGLSNIGCPLPTEKIYILDEDLKILPHGVTGELYVAGKGVCRGYLKRDQLTSEKFIMNPYIHGERMYKSGDLAYFLPNGELVYVGRKDNQIQLKGFRIELDEVNTSLRHHEAVKNSVILAKKNKNGHGYLCGYVVLNRDIDSDELRDYLRQTLPSYMVPACIVKIKEFPLTLNGKIDKNALTELDVDRMKYGKNYLPPRNKLEHFLLTVWEDVVDLKNIGIDDDFFSAGADSVHLIQIVSMLTQAGYSITIQDIFDHPTIAELSGYIGEKICLSDQNPMDGTVPLKSIQTKRKWSLDSLTSADTFDAVPQAEQIVVTGPVGLTHGQYWFLYHLTPRILDPHCWNLDLLVEIDPDLDAAFLQQAVYAVFCHHDGLRTRFVHEDHEWQAYIVNPKNAEEIFFHIDLATLPDSEIITTITSHAYSLERMFVLNKGSLFRVVLFTCGADRPGYLLMFSHHLNIDGFSQEILQEDLLRAYRQLHQQEVVKLPPKTLSMQQWTELLANYVRSDEMRQEQDYWLSLPWQKIPHLPLDYPENLNTATMLDNMTVKVILTDEETKALQQQVLITTKAMIKEVLLMAIVQTITQWTNGEWIEIKSIDFGRNIIPAIDPLLVSRTIGWFATSAHLVLKRTQTTNPLEALHGLKDQLGKIPNRGLGYSLLTSQIEDRELRERLHALSKAEVVFNYTSNIMRDNPAVDTFQPFRRKAPGFEGKGINTQSRPWDQLFIDSSISAGCLQIQVKCSGKLYKKSTIETLAGSLLIELQRLIRYGSF